MRASARRTALWSLVALAGAAPALLALAALAGAWRAPDVETWRHLADTRLAAAALDSIVLACGVALLAGLVGGALALLTALYEFPGRRWLAPALLLPLALPTYVLAFVWVGAIDVGSELRALAVATTGHARWLPELRTASGAIVLLALALYPYVYLLVRAALVRDGSALYEAARSQGLGPFTALVRGVLPVARPALIAGMLLVALETLAEFGAMAVLGVDTLAVLVYRTWFGLRSLPAAVQLASVLALVALALAFAERALRAHAARAGNGRRRPRRIVLTGARGIAAAAAATVVLLLGFVLPALQLLRWMTDDALGYARLLAPLGSTVVLGSTGALLVVVAGVAIVHARQAAAPAWFPRALRHLATLGYAVPGTVLAVGVLFALVAIERAFDLRAVLGFALSSSLVAVLLALVARFARVGVDAAETGYGQLRPVLGEAAATLGLGRARRWLRVDLPLLRPALLAGLMLAFVECVKELPATLMLRPFGWDTLAVKVYNATSEGLWQQAAAPALLIAFVGLVPALMLMRRLD